MTKKKDFKAYLPYVLAIALFLIATYMYFPSLLEGKRIQQHDILTFKGMSKEIVDYREKTGEEPLWTNSMFGGMPAYLISTKYKGNLINGINDFLQIGPAQGGYLLLLLIGSFILLLALGVNPWLSIAGAFAIAFSSYNFVIMAAGHNSKVVTIGYLAPLLGSIILTFRGKRILGTALTGLFMSLQILAGHPQITYYTLIIVIFFGLSQLIFALREKQVRDFFISVGMLVVIVGIAVLSNFSRLATTMEYDDYSMRSKSELTTLDNDDSEGLSIPYATRWSYGIDETMTLMIPGFKGGANNVELDRDSNTYEALARLDRNFAGQFIQHVNLYWGKQPGTMGPVYVGAIVVFLFVLGMFIVHNRYRWWILAVTVLAVMLSWGKNFMGLTEFFMEYIPGYSKFRTVTMILVIPQITMPLLGILALKKALFEEIDRQKLLHALKWSAGITGGLALLFLLFPSLAGNFSSGYDMRLAQMYSNDNPQIRQFLVQNLVPALEADREAMLRTDAFRSLVFIVLAAGLIYLYRIKGMKINQYLLIAGFGLLFLVDMWPVNKRFLNEDYFKPESELKQAFTPSTADQFILQQPGVNKRVLNLSVSTFQDASTSYFHHSIGGYHGAKMRRYQDLIETRLDAEISMLFDSLRAAQSQSDVAAALKQANVLNMLNTRYIIANPRSQPIINPFAAGNAWFVHDYRVASDADEEVQLLSEIDIRDELTIDRRYAAHVEGKTFVPDTSASIALIDYTPKKLTYRYNAGSEQLAVFSEIYYEKGWQITVDEKDAEHFRVNYTLRGMVLPEGEHQIVFEFRPKSYYMGEKVSLAGSILLILAVLGGIGYEVYTRRKRTIKG